GCRCRESSRPETSPARARRWSCSRCRSGTPRPRCSTRWSTSSSPTARTSTTGSSSSSHSRSSGVARANVLVLACGALAREVLAIVRGLEHVEVRCLPAALHSFPQQIAPAVDRELRESAGRYDQVFVAYADCGTAGALDR